MSVSKLTPEQAFVITGFTGVLCCKFSDFHADVERRKGGPIWTHQFAGEDGLALTKTLYKDDFFAMLPEGTPIDG